MILNGVNVSIMQVEIITTYEGLMLGTPNAEMNDELTLDGLKNLPWCVKTIMIPPAIIQEDDFVRLPSYRVRARLFSLHAKDDSDFSHLGVAFFTDNVYQEKLEDLIYNQIKHLDWLAEAECYYV